MTPVKFDTSGNMQVTTSADTQWFNYDEKKWANAKTADGSMWVWIPRFAYKIESPGTEVGSQVDVIFLNGTSNKYLDSEGKLKDLPSGYMVHPAFDNEIGSLYTNGGYNKALAGIWVSKFEASYPETGMLSSFSRKESNITYKSTSGVSNAYGAIGTSTKMIYPIFTSNGTSYNQVSIGDAYAISLELTKTGNPYRLPSTAKSHMLKNSEWGAVAYLTASKYGVGSVQPNTKDNTSGSANAFGITGYDSYGAYCGSTYTSNASTTGNKFGVFDLVGACSEFTSGHIENDNANIANYAPAFVQNNKNMNTELKNVYFAKGTSIENFQIPSNMLKVGEAIWETSNGVKTWGNRSMTFPENSNPFFIRGGSKDNLNYCNIFSVNSSSGAPSLSTTFRCAITEN